MFNVRPHYKILQYRQIWLLRPMPVEKLVLVFKFYRRRRRPITCSSLRGTGLDKISTKLDTCSAWVDQINHWEVSYECFRVCVCVCVCLSVYLSHLHLFINDLARSKHQLFQPRQTILETLHFLHAGIVDGRQQRRDFSRQRLTQLTVILTHRRRHTDRHTNTQTVNTAPTNSWASSIAHDRGRDR